MVTPAPRSGLRGVNPEARGVSPRYAAGMELRKHISDAMGSRTDKPWKATLFEGRQIFLGVNVLESGQAQALHTHPTQDKFCFVHAGTGRFTVGAQSFDARHGDVVFMPANVAHGVENRHAEQLVLLLGIAPPHGH